MGKLVGSSRIGFAQMRAARLGGALKPASFFYQRVTGEGNLRYRIVTTDLDCRVCFCFTRRSHGYHTRHIRL